MTITNEALFIVQSTTVIVTSLCMRQLGSQAMVSWLCLQAILANLLVLKTVRLFGLVVTVSDAFMIGSLFTLNLLREDYGAQTARGAIQTSFVLLLSTTALLYCHCAFIAASGDQMGAIYTTLLQHIIPIMAWSALIFTLTQAIDTVIFELLKRTYPSHHLAWRILLSIAVTQVIDTGMFTLFALDGWIAEFWDVFIWSYAIKVGMTIMISFSAFF